MQPRYAISLLARLVSLDNPITNEVPGSIMPNVRNNNNITLRNTFLADIGAPPQIVWVGGIGNTDVVIREVRSLIEGGNSDALAGLLNVELLPGSELWDKWASTGFKGEGVEIVSDGVVKITNFEIAKLLDIPFDENDPEPLAIRVTIISSSGKIPNGSAIPNRYAFAISHQATHPVGIEPESSPCIFEVNDIRRHIPTNYPNDVAQISIHPNPFKQETQISFQLSQASTVNLLVYDIQGKLVRSIYEHKSLEQGNHTYTLAEPTLNSGLYIVMLQTEQGIKSEKLMKID
ncbi:MAG: T9SS type A sorting domain-containing protein [Sphingobacteriales bacterium]|nr:T9SS type A sorting domain-containing protein [Sphingobacteriales bacterium]